MEKIKGIASRVGELSLEDWLGLAEERRKFFLLGLDHLPFRELSETVVLLNAPNNVSAPEISLLKLYQQDKIRGTDAVFLKTRGMFWQGALGGTHPNDTDKVKHTVLWGLDKKANWIRVELSSLYIDDELRTVYISIVESTLKYLLGLARVSPMEVCAQLRQAAMHFYKKRQTQLRYAETILGYFKDHDNILRAVSPPYAQLR